MHLPPSVIAHIGPATCPDPSTTAWLVGIAAFVLIMGALLSDFLGGDD
jgi:hypothetical protein